MQDHFGGSKLFAHHRILRQRWLWQPTGGVGCTELGLVAMKAFLEQLCCLDDRAGLVHRSSALGPWFKRGGRETTEGWLDARLIF